MSLAAGLFVQLNNFYRHKVDSLFTITQKAGAKLGLFGFGSRHEAKPSDRFICQEQLTTSLK